MNQPASDLAGLVLAFVKHEVPPPGRNNISVESDLLTDLCMSWEDAERMLSNFFASFKVDRGDFDFSLYLPNEGGLLSNLSARLSGKRRPKMQPEKLTVGMLARAAEAGIWRSDAIGGPG